VWTDMALEQSVNLDSKSKGGIIGISQKAETLERWFITCHERAAITSAIKEICGIEDSDRVGSHKESSLSRIRRDEDDVRKLMDMFSSGMLSNPFVKQGEDNEVMPLVNFASGTVMPRAAAEKLIQANELGAAQMNEFIAKRLKSNTVSFWDALPNLKIPLFTKLTETKKVKVADEKTATIAADRELFGRLIIAAKARDIDVKDVLTYELSSVPFALAHSDGTLRKVNKSTLLAILERDITVSARISKPNDQTRTCLIIDGMALIQMMKTGGCITFGDMAVMYYKTIISSFGQYHCSSIDLVFDSYRELSIKAGERQTRGSTSALEVKIYSHATPLPKQWTKYITNIQNKRNLCSFLVEYWCEHGIANLEPNKEIVIGGGFSENLKASSIKKVNVKM
ncbi:MAG: hypothetical protein N0E48_04465, partial [Candidatus Thiodiazotropha endolucinida]|nr:hypothetical protein [Candidatus Thiodiazotropha taylori]MCW4342602.1 hypothetical protein [Candidatus Thiodiazotropha endolucinida]